QFFVEEERRLLAVAPEPECAAARGAAGGDDEEPVRVKEHVVSEAVLRGYVAGLEDLALFPARPVEQQDGGLGGHEAGGEGLGAGGGEGLAGGVENERADAADLVNFVRVQIQEFGVQIANGLVGGKVPVPDDPAQVAADERSPVGVKRDAEDDLII